MGHQSDPLDLGQWLAQLRDLGWWLFVLARAPSSHIQ